MYKAKIIDSKIEEGKLTVSIEYADGAVVFTDKITTAQQQKDDWVEDNIQRKLGHLNNMPSLKDSAEEKKGDVIEQNPESGSLEKPFTEMEEYKHKLVVFEKYVTAIAKGIVSGDATEFIELHDWLKTNYRSEYITLFGN